MVLLGFGNVGQSLTELIRDHDGYSTEGTRIVVRAVFDGEGESRSRAEKFRICSRPSAVTAV